MVSRILLAIMAVQVACALLIWYAAAGYVPADLALVLAVLAVVLVRLTITANNFLLSRRAGSAAPPSTASRRRGTCASCWRSFARPCCRRPGTCCATVRRRGCRANRPMAGCRCC
ncbi:hypothetical protein [Pseudoduganella plicata]|uniref:hypothetical protein n=1 Tax=Pseudoduganella plicata TaxID=321984 RepID=UPI001E2B3A02|nr:hypothetical protein [Pseudoduganella plicata]